jgi:hypothetical protein
MTITEKNKLIAEFMGYGITRIVDELPTDKDGNYTTEGGKWVWVNELQYNHNWHHLMAVIHKIYGSEIENEYVLIVRDALADASIVGTYDAVVEFITWYNKNKQNA